MRHAFKALMVFGLTIALLIALSMIRGTVQDRQRYRSEAVEEVARSTAGAQSLEGPVLFVPFSDRVATMQVDAKGVSRPVEQVKSGTWVFFPQSLEVQGTVRSVPRMRGLHEVRVFELDSTQRATFRVRIPRDDDPATPRTIGTPKLGVGIRDARGLVGVPSLRVMGTQRNVLQGQGRGNSGLHTTLAAPAEGAMLAFEAEFKSSIQGTETLSIVPLAERNVIALDSTWPHPQFHGDFLPRTRATGQVVDANDAISVSLVDPVNIYSKVDRATKYGGLFVLLTFVAFALFEFLEQLRIHPIQYGLVGLAVAIFFLLLLALSERIPFGIAYLVASVACVALIGYYLGPVLGGGGRAGGFAGLLGTLYAALYGLLISEDNAMVLGAGLLFLVLAAIMVWTRKVDWYR
jgi:inner membrane protein